LKRQKISYEESHRNINDILEKKCNKHNLYFPEENPWIPCTLEYFYKNVSSKKDGLNTWCKKCAIQKSSNKLKELGETRKKYRKNSYQKNKEKEKKQAGLWFKNNKERALWLQSRWRKSDRGKEKYSFYGQIRKPKNHKMTSQEWIDTKEYFKNDNGEYCCAYCGMTEDEHKKFTTKGLHREHVIDNGRNDIKNCVPACIVCNRAKDDKPLNEFYNSNNRNYTYEKYYKIYIWLRYDCLKYIVPRKVQDRVKLKRLSK